jgi:hypothetical protein
VGVSGDTGAASPCSHDQANLLQELIMKVIVTVDCTPLEAREFLGLPDVQPMQSAMMDQMQKKMMDNIDKFSPESIMQSWFSFDPKMGERFQEMFTNMAGLGARPKDKK